MEFKKIGEKIYYFSCKENDKFDFDGELLESNNENSIFNCSLKNSHKTVYYLISLNNENFNESKEENLQIQFTFYFNENKIYSASYDLKLNFYPILSFNSKFDHNDLIFLDIVNETLYKVDSLKIAASGKTFIF